MSGNSMYMSGNSMASVCTSRENMSSDSITAKAELNQCWSEISLQR